MKSRHRYRQTFCYLSTTCRISPDAPKIAAFATSEHTHNVGEEGIVLVVRALQLVPSDEFVCVQVEDDDGGMGNLLGFAQNIGQSGVHDPEAVARVHFHAEGRDYLVGFGFCFFRRQEVCVPVGIGDEGG